MTAWLRRAAEDVGRDLLAIPLSRGFETWMGEFRSKVTAVLDQRGVPEALWLSVRAFSRVLRRPEVRARVASEFERDLQDRVDKAGAEPEVAEVRDMVLELADSHPLLPFVVAFPLLRSHDLPEHPFIESGRTTFRAALAWTKWSSHASAESRATALVGAIHTVAEGPYKDYLGLLWRLVYVRDPQRKERDQPNTIGALVHDVRRKLPGLVDQEMVFLRNAIAHNTWRYLPDRSAVHFENEGRDKKVKVRVIPVAELEEKLNETFQTGAMVPMLVRNAVMADLFRRADILAAGLDAVAAIGVEDGKEIERRFAKRISDRLRLNELFPPQATQNSPTKK